MVRRRSAVTLITLLIVLAIGGYTLYQQRQNASRPPVVEREVRGAVRGVSPAPEFLLRHEKELGLTTEQRRHLGTIVQHYRRDVAPAQARLEAAARQYEQYLAQKSGPNPSAKDLGTQGAEVSRLSGVVAATRHSYWQQARGVLTPSQQAKADTLARGATLRDLG